MGSIAFILQSPMGGHFKVDGGLNGRNVLGNISFGRPDLDVAWPQEFDEKDEGKDSETADQVNRHGKGLSESDVVAEVDEDWDEEEG